MSLRRTLTIAGIGAAALTLPATAAVADGPLATTHNAAMCGQVSIIFTNNSDHDFVADYKVGDQEGEADEVTGTDIDGGTHDGEPFGPVYTLVDVPAGETVTEVVDVEEDTEVSYRIWRGPENDWYVPWQSATVAACESDDTGEGEPGDGEGGEGGPGDSGEDTDPGGGEGGGETDAPETETPEDTDPGEDDKPTPDETEPADDNGAGELPVTGGALAGLVAAGVATLGAGGGALYLSRKRKPAGDDDVE